MSNFYPRESVEFIPVTVTVDGASVSAGVEVCVTTRSARPVDWADPVELEGQIGVMTGGQDPGTYTVWARVTDNPEIPVIECGTYRIT